MGKKSPAPPPAPDPNQVAAAQFGSNLGSAQASSIIGNPNIVGPYGSTTYSQGGDMQSIVGPNGQTYQVPRYTQTTTLSPEQQKLYQQQTQIGQGVNDLAIGQVGRLADVLGKPIDSSGLPSVGNYANDRTAVEDALFQRLQPQMDRQYTQLYDRLKNQGLQEGTEAWKAGMDDYNRGVNDLRLGVTGQGLQEQQGLFGMAQAGRQNALQEMLALRNQPINEISALQSGGQVSLPNTPGYNPAQVAPTNVGDYMYNSAALNQQNYQTQMQNQAATTGGLFGLGQAGIMAGAKYAPQIAQAAMFMSDRRLKRDIVDLGVSLLNGAKLYAYRYVNEAKRRVGVMADELQKINPAAVTTINGFLAVNYGRL